MRAYRALLCVTVVVACQIVAHASPFVVFPKAGQLTSPNGRFVVRNTDREAPFSELAGTFHFLILDDTASGSSRKLCDYSGVVAVAWAENDLIIVTQYSKRTSRTLVFNTVSSIDPVVIDKPLLTHIAPDNLRSQLQGNDHVFVEASRVDGKTLMLRVWGYGQRDATGFSWRCEYNLLEGGIACAETKRP